MSCTRFGSPARDGRHRRGPCLPVLALTAIAALASSVSRTAAATVSPSGSIGGLEAKFVEVGGVKTRYYEAGAGVPVVLVHGEGWSGHSSANIWAKNLPGLSKRLHVFAVDKLASGMTANPANERDYNLQGEVEHMYQFIQTMKLGRVNIVGESRGGTLALFLAALHPDVVKTLIIVNCGEVSPDASPNGRAAALVKCPTEPDFEAWKCRFRAMSFAPDAAFDDEFWEAGRYMASLPKSLETVAKKTAGAGEPLSSQFPWVKTALLERIRHDGLLQMPTLLYWGVDDPNNPLGFPPARAGLELYQVIAARNPKARMFIANGSGHFHFREHPDEFNYNISNFIEYWNRASSGAN